MKMKGVETSGVDIKETTYLEEGSNRMLIGNGRWDVRPRRIELTPFDGENPEGWVLKVERYFLLHQMSNSEKLETAILSLEGEALIWFQWANRCREFLIWEDLRSQLIRRFRPATEGTMYQEFMEYRRKFEALVASLTDISDQVYLSKFINGLKPEVRAEVEMTDPMGLQTAMEIAQKVENKLRLLRPKLVAREEWRRGRNVTMGGQSWGRANALG